MQSDGASTCRTLVCLFLRHPPVSIRLARSLVSVHLVRCTPMLVRQGHTRNLVSGEDYVLRHDRTSSIALAFVWFLLPSAVTCCQFPHPPRMTRTSACVVNALGQWGQCSFHRPAMQAGSPTTTRHLPIRRLGVIQVGWQLCLLAVRGRHVSSNSKRYLR